MVTWGPLSLLWTDRLVWKNDLPATSFEDGNNNGLYVISGYEDNLSNCTTVQEKINNSKQTKERTKNSETNKRTNQTKSTKVKEMGLCARCLDVFLMFLIFTPIIALYKATGNELVEKAVLKHNPVTGAWLLLAIGIGIKVTLLTLRHCLAGTVLAVSASDNLQGRIQDFPEIGLRVGSARPKFYYVDLLLILHQKRIHNISESNGEEG